MFNSRGQILLEAIIASLVIMMASLAIVQLVGSTLKGTDTTLSQGGATFLAQEIAESMNAVAQEDWHNITNLTTSSANKYYTSISGGKWVTAAGTENIALNNLTYNRYFYLTDVYRSTSSGDIVTSGGYYDPSTTKVNVNINWTDSSSNSSSTFSQVEYLSRFYNSAYAQTDWSGGTAGEVVTSVATTTFATSTSVDVTTTVGSIQLPLQ